MNKRRREAGQRRKTVPSPRAARKSLPPVVLDLLILVSIWLIFVLPFVIAGRTILPVDWHGVTPGGAYGYPEPQLPHLYSLDADAATGLDIAGYKYVSDSIRAGHLPFWNPYQHLGFQMLAESGTLVLYPFGLLHLVLPPVYWDLPQFLQFLCAALGLYFLSREYGVARPAAIVCGACAFAAGHLAALLCVTTVMSGMLWMPLLLLSIERAIRTDAVRPALLPGVAGVFLLSTSCNPGLGVIIVLAVVLYAIARVATERKWKTLLKAAVPLMIGGLCSAPMLLPFLSNTAQFQSALDPHASVIQMQALPAIFFPFLYSSMMESGAFGDVHAIDGAYWPNAWIAPPLTFLAMAGALLALKNRNRQMLVVLGLAVWIALWAVGVPPFNVVSYIPVLWRLSTSYLMGPFQMLLCLLAGYAMHRWAAESTGTWRAILGVWFGFVTVLLTIAYTIYRHVLKPDMDWIRGSSLPAVLWAVLPPLAIWASGRVDESRRERTVLLVSLAAVVAGGIAFFPSGGSIAVSAWLRFIPLQVFLVLAVLLIVQRRVVWGWALPIATLFVMNTGLLLTCRAWPKRYDPYTAPNFVKYLQEHVGSARSYMMDLFVFPNFSSALGISSVDVLEPILPFQGMTFFGRFLDRYQGVTFVYGIPRGDYSPVAEMLRNRRYWDYAGVRYVVTGTNTGLDSADYPQADPFSVVFRDTPAKAQVWLNPDAQPIVYLAPETVQVAGWQEGQDRFAGARELRRTAYVEGSECPGNAGHPQVSAAEVSDIRVEPNRVFATVNAHTGGALVLVGSYASGWFARIDGKREPAFRVNGALVGTCLAAPGKYAVSFEFVPSMWWAGLLCAGVGIGWFVVMRWVWR